MNAIELAERLDPNLPAVLRTDVDNAAAMLRRQHEQIMQLQEQNTYLDKIASELQDTCDRQAIQLGRQHEAILTLREAITQSQECVSWPHTSIAIRDGLEKALKDTEKSK